MRIPSATSEADYIWRTILDIDFFDENQYQLSLPKGKLIENLKEKSRAKSLSDHDYAKLVAYLRDSVHDRSDYKKGYDKVVKQINLVEKLVNQLDESNFNWNFKRFNTYTVNLTLYGPGGSFDPEEGSILLFTTKDGQFKNYANPANTMIHEIVHIGIEKSIVSKYQVPHSLKERIVDNFVMLNFKTQLPQYKIQNMGDYRSDKYLKSKEDMKELNEIVQKIINKDD